MFDTLHVTKSLKEAGFEEPQAEAVVIAFGAIIQDLATKDDLKDVYRHLWIMGIGLTAAFAAVSSVIQVMLRA